MHEHTHTQPQTHYTNAYTLSSIHKKKHKNSSVHSLHLLISSQSALFSFKRTQITPTQIQKFYRFVFSFMVFAYFLLVLFCSVLFNVAFFLALSFGVMDFFCCCFVLFLCSFEIIYCLHTLSLSFTLSFHSWLIFILHSIHLVSYVCIVFIYLFILNVYAFFPCLFTVLNLSLSLSLS